MTDSRILVTGATGFVGGALIRRLIDRDSAEVVAPSRQGNVVGQRRLQMPVIDGIGPATDWRSHLDGVDAVVHCAGRVHVMTESVADPLAAFRATNVEGTLKLAQQAAMAGVRRFVFLSSIKVNGEATSPGHPFTEQDGPAPQDPYGRSKLEAEQALMALAESSAMEVVIIRPPLVYGPGVKANFRTMMRWLAKGIPLPLASVDNRRSLVGIDNLVDLISTCLVHPKAGNQVFLAADGHALSTPELLRTLSAAMGRRAVLFPVPVRILQVAGRLTGRASAIDRLCSSLEVDSTKSMKLLGWRPPRTVEAGLRATAGHFLESNR